MLEKTYRDILHEMARTKRKPSRFIKPSSLICPRKMAFEVMGIRPRGTLPLENLQWMEVGKWLHKMVQNHLDLWLPTVRPGWTFQSEIRLDEITCPKAAELFIHAFVDGYLAAPDPNDSIVLEIKTVGHSAIAALRAPKPDHREQINLYMYLVGTLHGELLYINRTRVEDRRCYEVSFSPDLLTASKEKIQQALNGATQGILPPTDVPDFICRTCSYRDYCDTQNKKDWTHAKDPDVE